MSFLETGIKTVFIWWELAVRIVLTISSIISLMALTERMNISGTSVVYRPVGDTSGICCSMAISRKKQLEYRRNCSNRNAGKKLMKLHANQINGRLVGCKPPIWVMIIDS